jgi:hypothetical protein
MRSQHFDPAHFRRHTCHEHACVDGLQACPMAQNEQFSCSLCDIITCAISTCFWCYSTHLQSCI